MTIETKYNVEDRAWMMHNNHAEQVEIAGIETEVDKHYYSTNPISFICEPKSMEMRIETLITYQVKMQDGTTIKVVEDFLFPTKEDFLNLQTK